MIPSLEHLNLNDGTKKTSLKRLRNELRFLLQEHTKHPEKGLVLWILHKKQLISVIRIHALMYRNNYKSKIDVTNYNDHSFFDIVFTQRLSEDDKYAAVEEYFDVARSVEEAGRMFDALMNKLGFWRGIRNQSDLEFQMKYPMYAHT